jgi:hypothetical protein
MVDPPMGTTLTVCQRSVNEDVGTHDGPSASRSL